MSGTFTQRIDEIGLLFEMQLLSGDFVNPVTLKPTKAELVLISHQEQLANVSGMVCAKYLTN